jgi:hypothetical protein
MLVTLDPGSGAESTVADLSTLAFQPRIGPLATNSLYPLIYTVGSYCAPTSCPNAKGGGNGVPYSEIVTINFQTAAVHVSPVLATTIYGQIAFDPATQTLWALTWCPCPSISIVRVDPTTGTETTVAQMADPLGPELPQLALDRAGHVLYVATTTNSGGQLLALDTTTGTLSAGLNLAAPVSSLVYDDSSATLFGVTTGTPQQLAKIDPATGTETGIATFGANIRLYYAAIDSASHTVFGVESNSLDGTARMVMVNDQTGTISGIPSMPPPLANLAFREKYPREAAQSPSIAPLPRGDVAQSAPSSPGPHLPVIAIPRQVAESTSRAVGSGAAYWPADERARIFQVLFFR